MDLRTTLLIVEDVELNRALLHQMFCDDFQIAEAKNGKEALEYLELHQREVAIVLLDVKMPVMDGYTVMEHMKEKQWLSHIPVVLITSDGEGDAMERGYQLGSIDVIFKPFKRHVVVQRVYNIVELYRHKNYLEEMVAKQTEELNRQYTRLQGHYEHLTEVIKDIVLYRNTESFEHTAYVREYSKILATHYQKLFPKSKMTKEMVEMIARAAAMHDVGKITMPDSLITRQGRLSDTEMEMLREHTIKGGELVRVMVEFESEEFCDICYNVCMYHHERYDGSGYPKGLKKDKIPVEAQLVGLADMYDILVHCDTNKEIFSESKAYYMLMNGVCGELAPRMKQCLESAREELEAYVLGD